jgi:hypothetical protein
MPDRFVTINKDGLIIGGENIILKRNDNLFDYVASKCSLLVLKKAMADAGNDPREVDIHFRYNGKKTRYLCWIYKSFDRYLIGGWRLPENLIHFPNKDTAA